jgi:hypothetical protein
METIKEKERKKTKDLQYRFVHARLGKRAGGPFSPGWYYQSGLKISFQS